MKRQIKRIAPRVCLWAGIALLVAGMLVLAAWQWNIHHSANKAASYAQTIRTLIPTAQNAVPEERQNNTMATLSVDGINFVGVLEMPRYQSVLPVGNTWGHLTDYPCRFSGSIYNSTLQIGATTQKGQYDFYREISVGDTLIFTDAEGNRYTYAITNLRYETHADQATLNREDATLTLFIKNIYAFEYLIVSCDIAG